MFCTFATADAQAPAPVADAFRKYARTIATNLMLAAEAMPAEKYGTRTTISERSFGEAIAYTANVSDGYCERLTSRRDSSGFADESSDKSTLVARLRAKLDFCQMALADLTDAGLSDTVNAFGPKSRAAAITEATVMWAEQYEHVVGLMRVSGIIPPVRCSGSGGPIHGGVDCGSGWSVCTSDRNTNLRTTISLDDAGRSVRSDGRGPYTTGGNVLAATVNNAAVMVLADPQTAPDRRRAIVVDLSKPVPGDIGVSRGIVRDDMNVRVLAQWRTDSTRRLRNLHGIPVGQTVPAGQITVEFHIGDVVHLLQAGPLPAGHCFTDGTAVHGNGTTAGTITRSDSTTWIVELPPNSVARLFDVSHRYPYAVDKGLYHVSMRFVLTGPASRP